MDEACLAARGAPGANEACLAARWADEAEVAVRYVSMRSWDGFAS